MKEKWKGLRRWQKALVLALAVALLGFGVSASGIIPVYASFDHPAPMDAILGFSMKRSVATHSLGIDVPDDLDDPALVVRGAGHYEDGCRFCHGTPGEAPAWSPDAWSPPPPRLEHAADRFDAAELYVVVRHGVVFTAMPAWPSRERSDEPWALVAFLRAAADMSAEDYRSMVSPPGAEADAPGWVRARCAHCHGTDGLGRDGVAPVLAGQRERYLRASLEAYANGERHSGFMELPASRLSEAEVREVARYFAGLPGLADEAAAGEDELGARIAREGIPARRIPACASCHGPSGHGRAEGYPILAGQNAAYLRDQLRLFVEGSRGGTAMAELMEPVASHELRESERRAVAAYYAADDR